MKSLDERLGLLPNLTTVVEAIAYAHSERVVHRDLKPQNILIGAFGEIVVIDWGLAKDLTAPPTAGAPYRDDGGGLTQAGAGTPAYMAPEQARGEAPDERVDVYALGATLHHVLAGDRPDLRPLPAETPRDLRAIVAKAMADNKEDRYPTALELASELQRFQEGQLVKAHRYTTPELVRRWLRRRWRIAGLATSFVIILAATAAVSVHRIVQERDRADSQRRGAERLVDFMLGTLRDRLKPMGRLDVLAGVGKEVEGFYASVSTDQETDPEVLRRRAMALEGLQKIDDEKGNYDDVRREASRAVELCERLEQISPSGWSAGCAVYSLLRLGDMENRRGVSAAALGWYRRADARLDTAIARHPDDAELHRARGLLRLLVGREDMAQNDYQGARVAFTRGVQVVDELVADDPKEISKLHLLEMLHGSLGDLEVLDGHPDAALAHLGASVEVSERERALEPDSAEVDEEWAVAVASVAQAARQLGDFSLARAQVARGLAVLRRRVESDPENQHWKQDFAQATSWACESELASGRLDDALQVCRESGATLEALARSDSDDWDPALNNADLEFNLADVYRERNELPAARATAAKEIELAAAWNVKKPGDAKWVRALSAGWWRLASVERTAGSAGPARAAASTALAIVLGVAESNTDFSFELAAARAQTTLAELDADGRDDRAAEAGFRRALDRLERDVERWPLAVEIQVRLALASIGLAEIRERSRGGEAEASRLRARAVSLLEPLELRGAVAYEFRGLLERARTFVGPRR
jgi:tetratricopeptide (TPR) repeat protein